MATTTLVCKQCNFENEAERVYCHNCGAKLDRSLLPPEATKRADPVVVQERVRKLVSPRRGSNTRWFRHLILSAAAAALLAMIAVMIEPPDNIPEINKDAATSAPVITDDMDGLVTNPTAGRLHYTEEQVNAFLQTNIHGGKREVTSGVVPLKYERAYVHFDEGVVRITYVQSVFGLPFYSTTVDTVSIQNGQLVAQAVGGSFGRLQVSPKLMPYLSRVFAPLWKVLDREKNLISRMDSMSFHKGTVDLVSKAGAAH